MTHNLHLVDVKLKEVEGKLFPKGYAYPFWNRYPHLAQILHQLYDGQVQGIKVLDLACGVGGGVRYLRKEFGIDAFGMDANLEESLREEDESKDSKYTRELRDLMQKGITINDSVENVDVYFNENSFDVFSIVYFGGFPILSKNVRNTNRTVKEKLSSILKPNGYQIKVREDDEWHPCWNIPGNYVWVLKKEQAGSFTGVKQHQK